MVMQHRHIDVSNLPPSGTYFIAYLSIPFIKIEYGSISVSEGKSTFNSLKYELFCKNFEKSKKCSSCIQDILRKISANLLREKYSLDWMNG